MRPVLGGAILALASCRPPAAPESPTTPPKPATASEPTAPKPVNAPPLAVSEAAIKAFAVAWCEEGGEQFAPPGVGTLDDWPPPLESCDDIMVDTLADDTAAGVRATLYRLEAPLEGRDVLLVSTADGTSSAILEHRLDDTSGEGPETYTDYGGAVLEDVFEDATPEWWIRQHYEEGDNYEADRCYATTMRSDALIFCRLSPTIECVSAEYASASRSAPREFLDDCTDPPPADEDPVLTGYENDVEVQRNVVVFTPTQAKFDESEDSPFSGRVSIGSLFKDD